MYRLIYFEPDTGYKTFDSENGSEILANENMLKENQVEVICVVDYVRQSISSKSPDFVKHTDVIDSIIFDPMYVTQF